MSDGLWSDAETDQGPELQAAEAPPENVESAAPDPVPAPSYEIPQQDIDERVGAALEARIAQARMQAEQQQRTNSFVENLKGIEKRIRDSRDNGDYGAALDALMERVAINDQLQFNQYQAWQRQQQYLQEVEAWRTEQVAMQEQEGETLSSMTELAVRDREAYEATFHHYPAEAVKFLMEQDAQAGVQSDVRAHVATATRWMQQTFEEHGLEAGAKLIHQFVASRRQAQAQAPRNPIYTAQPVAPRLPTPIGGGGSTQSQNGTTGSYQRPGMFNPNLWLE